MINKMIAEGAIVPVVVTCELIKKAMHAQGWNTKTFLVDGFPRNRENYDGWMEVMGDQIDFGGVLHYKVDDEEALIARILERGKTSGRTDDNEDTVRRRLDQYREQQLPIVNMFKEQGKVKDINGAQTIEEVYNDTKSALTGYI